MTSSSPLGGKRVLVSGGTTGIGRAVLHRLSADGARMLTFGRHAEPLAEALTAAQLPEDAGLVADAATRDGVAQVFDAVDARLGGIDILVANAALGAEPLDEMDEDGWRAVIDTNLTGYLACAQRALSRMEEQGSGHLVFVGSISADIKARGESVYAATKGGIAAFTQTLRKEVGDKGIRVTLIEPGSVRTEMQECDDAEKDAAIDAHRMLLPDDIADAIHYALTRPDHCDVSILRIEPRLQKTA